MAAECHDKGRVVNMVVIESTTRPVPAGHRGGERDMLPPVCKERPAFRRPDFALARKASGIRVSVVQGCIMKMGLLAAVAAISVATPGFGATLVTLAPEGVTSNRYVISEGPRYPDGATYTYDLLSFEITALQDGEVQYGSSSATLTAGETRTIILPPGQGDGSIYWYTTLDFYIAPGIGAPAVFRNIKYTYELDGGRVPEPATWALMIGGFGLVGAASRRRGRKSAIGAGKAMQAS